MSGPAGRGARSREGEGLRVVRRMREAMHWVKVVVAYGGRTVELRHVGRGGDVDHAIGEEPGRRSSWRGRRGGS